MHSMLLLTCHEWASIACEMSQWYHCYPEVPERVRPIGSCPTRRVSSDKTVSNVFHTYLIGQWLVLIEFNRFIQGILCLIELFQFLRAGCNHDPAGVAGLILLHDGLDKGRRDSTWSAPDHHWNKFTSHIFRAPAWSFWVINSRACFNCALISLERADASALPLDAMSEQEVTYLQQCRKIHIALRQVGQREFISGLAKTIEWRLGTTATMKYDGQTGMAPKERSIFDIEWAIVDQTKTSSERFAILARC